LCAELGEIEIVKKLLNLEIIADEPNHPINAQSVAYHRQQFKVLAAMLEANLTYPHKIDISKCTDDIRNFYKNGEDIHMAVRAKKLDKVADILKKNPKQTHYFNLLNESASKTALSEKSFEIYDILLANDVTFGPHENFNEIFGKLDESEREILRKIHSKYSKDLPENHMNILMMNTLISYDEFKKEDKEEYIRRAYKILDQDPDLSTILKTVAASKRFEIVFDFKRDSVQVLEASVDSNTKGSFDISGKICIGAKQLLDPETEHETFGTLAHELCHYAINLTYNNLAKPYLDCDTVAKEEYKKIVEYCKEMCHRDKIISYAFSSYSINMQHAELIVRVPHLLALHHNNPEKLKEIKEIFGCLFKFYIEKVIPAMTEALPNIKTKAANEMAEKDKKIWNLRKKFYFSIILTFIIATFISFFSYDPVYEYNKLTPRNKIRIGDATVNFKNVDLTLRNLFNDNSSAYKSLKSDQIKFLLSGKTLKFTDLELVQFSMFLNFTWIDLPDSLKTKVLDSDLIFQNQVVKIKNLQSDVFNFLAPQQIRNILNGDHLNVGHGTKIDSDFYINRNFILEDAKIIYFRSKSPQNDDEIDLRGTEQFHMHFMKKNFDDRFKIFSEIKKNTFYKFNSQFYDLNGKDFKSMLKNSTEIIQHIDQERIFILSSEPGAGKTITLQKLTLQIKEQFKTRWVSYIDLKEHTKLFGNAINPEMLLEMILGKNDSNIFEVMMFRELYKAGKVVLLWNGFDEIAPTYSEPVKNLIKTIYDTSLNIQYISTRILYSEELSSGLKFSLWQLVPFTGTDHREFFEKYLISKNVSSHDIDGYVEKFLNIITKLSDDGNSIQKFNTPLMLRLVAEVYENQKILDSINLYEIYNSFINKKIELWAKRGEIVNKMVPKFLMAEKSTPIQLYQKYGLLNGIGHFSSSTLIFKIKLLKIIQKKIPKDIPYDEISRMGIVYINGENNFEFAHRTFAEFFIAKYFIQNLYNADDDDNKIEDVELRLELFFLLTKRFNSYQKIITDFMYSYLENQDRMFPNQNKRFSDEIRILMRGKFNRFFFNLLDVDTPFVFEFIIKFFKKDHELLVDLLHLNKDETLYTAIYNPNYFASFIHPENITNYTADILSVDEFRKLTSGRNQKGVILYGMHFYDLINETKQSISFDGDILTTSNTFWDFFNHVMPHLNIHEKIQLFLSAISPKIYLFYNKFFNVTDIPEYKNMWASFEYNNLTSDVMQEAIGYALIKYIEIYPFNTNENLKNFFLKFLLEKAEKFLSNSQIFNMYMSNSFLHEINSDLPSFEALWQFLVNHTTFIERRQILSADDLDDHNYYFYWSHEDTRNTYSTLLQTCFFYDFTPFKIFHRSASETSIPTFDLTTKIYKEHFNDSEIRELINSSNYGLLYTFGLTVNKDYSKVMSYIERLYSETEELLVDYLDRKVKPIKLSVSEYFEDFKEVGGAQDRWFKNLKVYYALRNKTVAKIT